MRSVRRSFLVVVALLLITITSPERSSAAGGKQKGALKQMCAAGDRQSCVDLYNLDRGRGKDALWANDMLAAILERQKAQREAALQSVAKCDLDAVTALVKQDPDFVSVRNEKGETPLHVAVYNGCEDVTRFLLDNKADVDARNEYGASPLDYAVETLKTSPTSEVVFQVTFSAAIANLLFSHGAVVEDRMLLHVASSGSVPAVQWLLDHGAHVNARTENGGTALHDAAWMGNYEMVALLLARGADVNLERSDSCVGTPLHEAACHGHTRVAELLLANGANVNAINKDDHTPLYVAIHENGGGMTVTTQTTVYGGAEGNQRLSQTSDFRNTNDDVIQLLRKHGGHE